MSTAVLIPVEEYLRTSYDPDCDYVDGEVLERNLGERWHGAVQGMITAIFTLHRHAWGLVPIPEQRVQVNASRYRVPDVCVVRASDPFDPILHKPPVLCVEILSAEDRFSRILERVEEYLAMGVPEVWIIDPRSRQIWTVGEGGRPMEFAGNVLTVAGTNARVDVPEIFALIDEAPSPKA